MPETPPRLLHFRVSHFNEKVRWALDYKQWPHTREALRPGLHAPRIRRLTGQQAVPVLLLDGKPLHGSAAIIEELERRRPDPPLYPADPAQRARALDIQRYFDDEVAAELRRLFWSTYIDDTAAIARVLGMGFGAGTRFLYRAAAPVLRSRFGGRIGLDPDTIARARARLPEHLAYLEREIQASGYLVGDRFSVADLGAAAIMTAILRPPQFPYPLPEPWSPGLVELRESIASHPAARWVYGIYERHRGQSAET